MCILSRDYKNPKWVVHAPRTNPTSTVDGRLSGAAIDTLFKRKKKNISQRIFHDNEKKKNMELHLVLRTLCLIALICTCTLADSTNSVGDSLEDSFSLMGQLEKRQPFKKLRSYNPILIYHQSIRQPRYLPRINNHSEQPVSERDIPRRLIRRGNNKTHSNLQPLLVWNHQLLPNFYNKRQPPFFMSSLRRDGYPGGNKKNTLAVKRSGGWLSKSYDETNANGFPYDKFNYENNDYYQVENDFNEPEFEPVEAKNEDV